MRPTPLPRPTARCRPATDHKPRTTDKRGFTLVELIIVVMIIAMLAGMVLPAVLRARGNAQVAQVATEIKALDAALSDFKATFGVYPPSSITLYESPAGWVANPSARSRVLQLWNQFSFTVSRDINGDGDATDVVTLTSGECLVFFLGGIFDPPITTTSTGAPSGFSKNPGNPFQRGGGSRLGPYYQFDIGRLVDLDSDGFPEFKDPLPSQQLPYLYLSGYDGTDYIDGLPQGATPPRPTELPATMAGGAYQQTYIVPTATTRRAYWNAKSCQIISPGFDGSSGDTSAYGAGGYYQADKADDLLVDKDVNGDGTISAWEQRNAERDNITNFKGGTLAP